MMVKAHVSPGLRVKTRPQIAQRSSWDHPENSRPFPQCGQRLHSPRRSAVPINFEREDVIRSRPAHTSSFLPSQKVTGIEECEGNARRLEHSERAPDRVQCRVVGRLTSDRRHSLSGCRRRSRSRERRTRFSRASLRGNCGAPSPHCGELVSAKPDEIAIEAEPLLFGFHDDACRGLRLRLRIFREVHSHPALFHGC
jgi:hypothetical protein